MDSFNIVSKNYITLYHGSDYKIDICDINCNGSNKSYDFGSGFYLTENKLVAEEWAVRRYSEISYVNEYILDLNKISILNLSEEAWLQVVLSHRYKLGKTFFKSDLVYGIIVDDSLFETISDF